MPRPTGGPAIAAARERCARELKSLSYSITERQFTYSGFPGRFALPMLGAANAMLVGFAGMWALEGSRYAPSAVLLAGIAMTIVVARWMTTRGVLVMPLLRESGVNLEATRTGDAPRVWLCAHLDSKSQPVPTLVRSAGLVLEGLGVITATALGIIEAATGAGVPNVFWTIAGAVTLAGAIPVGLSMVGSRSPGALDNASGVATVIAAARLLGDMGGVGVLITDAEELGLAGARAWAHGRNAVTVLNCDGVDDDGELTVMRAGRISDRLTAALRSHGAAIGPHFPGVLTDAVAFADAGHESATISRGSIRSFVRVHSRRDDLNHLRSDGVAPTAVCLAATVRHLLPASA